MGNKYRERGKVTLTCRECGETKNCIFIGRRCQKCYNKYQNDWYHKNSEQVNKKTMEWRERNLEKYRAYQTEYSKNRFKDPDQKLKMNLKNRFGDVFRKYIIENKLKTPCSKLLPKTLIKIEELIGCKMEMLVSRMEKQWVKDYGCEIDWNDLFIPSCPDKLEIEHITNVCKFSFLDEEQIKQCYHFSNMKMLKQIDNRTGRVIIRRD